MDDLFAMEDLKCVENIWIADMRSYEDPVLVNDARILNNILTRQDNSFGSSVENYFETVQTEVKPHMRKIVSDWMLEVCEEQQCQAEVFHLAVNYMDRFLSRVPLQKTQFQLLGCVCMFLASKFKETCPLPSENLVIYTDNSVTTNEITVSPSILNPLPQRRRFKFQSVFQRFRIVLKSRLDFRLQGIKSFSSFWGRTKN